MTKEQLIALGLDDAAATKVAAASAEELKTYVSKAEHDKEVEAKKQLESDIKTRDKQLEELKKADPAGLQQKIEELQTANKTAKTEYEAKLKDLQLAGAIKLAVADKAQDVDLVAGLIDKTKLILSADGKITGLDEQVKTLQESKAFLFKQAAGAGGYDPAGGQGGAGVNPFAKETFNLTEQGKLFKTNPAQAKAMAAAAGVTI